MMVVAWSILLAASTGHAQDADVEAEHLFREGKELLKKGKIAEACVKFEASERAAHDLATLVNLADCRERNGELATSWALFLKAASEARTSKQDALEKVARKRAKALEGKLSYLTVAVPAGSRVDGLEIRRDGEAIDAALWDSAVPTDVGSYTIEATAPGHRAWTATVRVDRGHDKAEPASISVPPLEKLPDEVKPDLPPPDEDRPPPPPDDEPEPPAPRRGGSGRRTLGLVIGGAGGLATIGGVVFGVLAKGKLDKAEDLCGTDHACDDPALTVQANALSDDAALYGNVSTVLVGVGVAGLATGLVLYLTAPSGGGGDEHALRITPEVREGGFAVSISGVLP